LFNLVNNLIVAHVTSGNNNDVFTVVIGCMVISKYFGTEVSNLISISLDWLSNLMLSVNIEVRVFHCYFLVIVEALFVII